jgi:catechol 2,3-dioxygenase-like lactoylglutathione lyase family enzyme
MLALEVVTLPVRDIDAAITFYADGVGFALDVDYRPTDGFRVVQLTPSGSACSVHLEQATSPSRRRGLVLVTTDLVAERDRLLSRGVPVGDLRHKYPVETWSGDWHPGADPQHRDYASVADFADPDGNTWTLQERGHPAS